MEKKDLSIGMEIEVLDHGNWCKAVVTEVHDGGIMVLYTAVPEKPRQEWYRYLKNDHIAQNTRPRE